MTISCIDLNHEEEGEWRMSNLRKIEVFRNDEWIIVRMAKVKKDEIFKIYEGDTVLESSTWMATSDGFLWDIINGIGAINAMTFTFPTVRGVVGE